MAEGIVLKDAIVPQKVDMLEQIKSDADAKPVVDDLSTLVKQLAEEIMKIKQMLGLK